MNTLRHLSVVLFVALLFVALLSPVRHVGAAELNLEEMSTADVMYVRGTVSTVTPADMSLSVRPLKEKLVTVHIDGDTELEGVNSIDELARKDQVKVWYSIRDGENMAIKIIRLMDLGC